MAIPGKIWPLELLILLVPGEGIEPPTNGLQISWRGLSWDHSTYPEITE